MQEGVSLKPYNTFGIDVKARLFAAFHSLEELQDLLPSLRRIPFLLSGGGSNMLFTQDFDGIFVRNRILGIEEVVRSENEVVVSAGAGENWHQFVQHCVSLGYGGLENLSLIPGCVGASPMQNIGAYGVEIKDVFEYLDAVEIATGNMKRFYAEDCAFGYRESVFKRQLKNEYIICSVAFRLSLNPKVNTSYGVIEAELERMSVKKPSIKDVSQAVINIRKSKLPDPTVLGNAGSFFKNPVVPEAVLDQIRSTYEKVPSYPAGEGTVKLAAGWLIEQAGWKGKRVGAVGVHELQALVLVNYGGGTGKEVYDLSQEIIEDIQQKFGVSLEREVNIY
ncbi:MAG: UDP-N-acetylmuramate dehydrogenase [Flavobacteriia bacterium]|jgi:UDP-N-acetylmuramate dehydrogenase|nr:UDP-N-acetylmuramate dehydrogenase [Flavobacteriia bacterium]